MIGVDDAFLWKGPKMASQHGIVIEIRALSMVSTQNALTRLRKSPQVTLLLLRKEISQKVTPN